MELHIRLQNEDIKLIREQVTKVINEQLRQVDSSSFRKHAYTVTEVAEQIGYCTKSIRGFIREGRRDRFGKHRYLLASEITTGDFRITPKNLDDFLSYF